MPPKKRVKPVKAENLASSAESENDENAEPTLVAKNGATAILPAPRLGRACKRTVTKRKSLEHISDQQEQTSSVATAKANEKASKKATAIKAEAVPQVIKKKFTSVSASNILDKAVTSIKQSKIPVIDINSSSSDDDDDDIDSADDFTVLPKTSTRVTVKRVVSSAKLVKQSSSSSVLKSITNQNDLKTQNVAAHNQAESITGSRGPGRKTKKSSVNATKKNGASATVSTSNSQESVRMATQESVPLSDEEDEPMGKIPRVFVVVVQRLYVSYC